MKTINKKIASGLLIGSIFLSLGASVFANQDNPVDPGSKPGFSSKKEMPRHNRMMEDAKAKLDKLVADGVITSDQANKIIEFGNEKMKQFQADKDKTKNMTPEERQAHFKEAGKKMPEMLAELKTAANLTDDQAKAVVAALRPKRPMMNPEQLAQNLGKLVTDGTITQAQSDSLVSFMQEKFNQMKADMEKVKEMTPDERKAYFAKHPKTKGQFAEDLKAAAGLTDDQAKAVVAALHPRHPMMNKEQLPQNLSKLVTDGTITQAQSDSIVSFMQEKFNQMKSDMEKVKAMSPDERKAYFAEHPKNKGQIAEDLKAAAGLTDSQAKAVLQAIRPQQGQHHQRPEATKQ